MHHARNPHLGRGTQSDETDRRAYFLGFLLLFLWTLLSRALLCPPQRGATWICSFALYMGASGVAGSHETREGRTAKRRAPRAPQCPRHKLGKCLGPGLRSAQQNAGQKAGLMVLCGAVANSCTGGLHQKSNDSVVRSKHTLRCVLEGMLAEAIRGGAAEDRDKEPQIRGLGRLSRITPRRLGALLSRGGIGGRATHARDPASRFRTRAEGTRIAHWPLAHCHRRRSLLGIKNTHTVLCKVI